MSGPTVNINNSNLLVYYPFNVDLLNYASGTGVNDASATNVSITTTETSMTNGSILFPGISTQQFKIPSVTFAAGGVTISFWIKFLSAFSNAQYVFDFWASSSNNIFCRSNNTIIRTGITNTNVFDNGYNADFMWRHLCYTIAPNGSWTAYIDGVTINILSINGVSFSVYPPSVALTSCLIGANNQGSVNYANFCLNNFIVFNRTLTATEVSYLFNFQNNLTFTSSPTTTSSTLSSYDSYALTPSSLKIPISVPTVNVQYTSYNHANGTMYSLNNNATVVGTRFFISKNTFFYSVVGGVLCAGNYATGCIYTLQTNSRNLNVYNLTTLLTTITLPETATNWHYDASNNSLYCAGATSITIVDLAAQTYRQLMVTGGLTSVTLGPDGFFYGVLNANIKKINPTTGTATTIITSTNGWLSDCDFDGNGFLYCIDNGTGKNIFKYNVTTAAQVGGTFATVPNSGVAYSLVCDKSTNTLYVSSGTTAIHSIKSDGTISPFGYPSGIPNGTPMSGNVYGISYDANSGLIFSICSRSNGSVYNCIFPTKQTTNYSLSYSFPSSNIKFGTNVLQVYNQSNAAFGSQIILNVACFLEGTLIKCLADNMTDSVYIPVEKLTKNTYVLTRSSGYVQIHVIGYADIFNPGEKTENDNRLFKYSASNVPDVFKDLYITGNHSALVETFSRETYDCVVKHMGAVYETEKMLRLPACLDSRAEPFLEPGSHRIWHFALQNPDIYTNYGVYANGLLVESSSIRYMTELSKMELV